MSSQTPTEGRAFADRLTRTQWLLLLMLGVLMWLGGGAIQQGLPVFAGLAVIFVSALGAKNTIRKG